MSSFEDTLASKLEPRRIGFKLALGAHFPEPRGLKLPNDGIDGVHAACSPAGVTPEKSIFGAAMTRGLLILLVATPVFAQGTKADYERANNLAWNDWMQILQLACPIIQWPQAFVDKLL